MTEWQPIFMTKPYTGETTPVVHNDKFIAAVMSVEIYGTEAAITSNGSDWLMPAYPGGSHHADHNEGMTQLKVGDRVRVGTAAHGGTTDWLTILEVLKCTKLYNMHKTLSHQLGESTPVVTPTNGTSTTFVNTLSANPDGANYTGSGSGASSWVSSSEYVEGAMYAIRVDKHVDATTLPTGLVTYATITGVRTLATQANRALCRVGPNVHSNFYYPMYKLREQAELRVNLPYNVKMIAAIRLLGYSIQVAKNVSEPVEHEHAESDWYALRFKEVGGDVISSNQYANGAFHVIHTSGQTTELYAYEPLGLATVFTTPRNMPTLTAELLDKDGKKANVGRVHLWVEVLK